MPSGPRFGWLMARQTREYGVVTRCRGAQGLATTTFRARTVQVVQQVVLRSRVLYITRTAVNANGSLAIRSSVVQILEGKVSGKRGSQVGMESSLRDLEP